MYINSFHAFVIVTHLSNAGEYLCFSGDVDSNVVLEWCTRLKEICKTYSLKNIFNCDESGLFYRMLFSRSLVQKGESCSGGKMSKERLTFLLGCSAEGEKLKPLVIGKSENPRCFRGYNKHDMGVKYTSNRKAWMTGPIFETWLRQLNNRMVLLGRDVLLFLDNCSSHPHLELSNVKLSFLPPNTTSRLQPMDAGIIQTVKLRYRKKLLQHICFLMDEESTASEIAKKVSIDILLAQQLLYLNSFMTPLLSVPVCMHVCMELSHLCCYDTLITILFNIYVFQVTFVVMTHL